MKFLSGASMTLTKLNPAELNAVLAGLRLLQERRESLPRQIADIYESGGDVLGSSDIDSLCQRINLGEDRVEVVVDITGGVPENAFVEVASDQVDVIIMDFDDGVDDDGHDVMQLQKPEGSCAQAIVRHLHVDVDDGAYLSEVRRFACGG